MDIVATVTEELRRATETALESAKEVFARSPATVETALTVGQVAHEIVRAASEADTDLLVVGARGLGGFKRLLLGSVSDNVLHHAPCSVLVVKHR